MTGRRSLRVLGLSFLFPALLGAGLASERVAVHDPSFAELRDLERAVISLLEAASPAFVFIEGGSGFLISEEGHVLTNEHVVAGKSQLPVFLAGGRRFEADVLGHDPGGDLAVLKLREPPGVAPLLLGDSDSLRVGQRVVALGDPFLLGSASLFLPARFDPGGPPVGSAPPSFEPSASLGTVSAVHRYSETYFDSIQVDVAVNKGNSGGPLLTFDGKVVGVNGKIETRFDIGINTGVGYAVPSNQILRFLEPLKRAEGGVIAHGTIVGLSVAERAVDAGGLPVTGVEAGSLAARVGFREGDRILEIAGYRAATQSRYLGILGSYPAGAEVVVSLARGAERLSLEVPLIEPGEKHLGIEIEELAEDPGIRVVKVVPGASAWRGGLKPQDIIREYNGQEVKRGIDLVRVFESSSTGDLIKVRVERMGKDLEVEFRLGGKGKGE